MLFIVEGPDETGKSTFVGRERFRHYDLSIVHSVKRNSLKAVITDALTFTKHYGENILLDRTPIISEYVYGPIIDERKWLHIGKVIDVLGWMSPLVIFYSKPASYAEVFAELEKNNEYKLRDHYEELCGRYDYLMTVLKRYFSVHELTLRRDKDALYADGLILDYLRRHNN